MEGKNIMQQGEEGKFLVAISHEGFDINRDDFAIKLSWGLSDKKMMIKKEDMTEGDFGTYLFMFDTVGMIGAVTAECIYYIPDDNFPDGLRTEVDRQVLAFVVSTANPKFVACPGDTSEHDVTYTRVNSSVVVTYSKLLTKNGEPLVTSDGYTLYVRGDVTSYTLTYTGDEVQELLDSIPNIETRLQTIENSN